MCTSWLLRAGRLLQHRLRGDLHGVQPDRHGRDLHAVPAGTRPPASAVTEMARHVLRHQRLCDGAGACQLYSRHGVRRRELHRLDADASADCDGTGACRPATTQLCDPFVSVATAACKTTCTDDSATASSPNTCAAQQLRQDTARRDLQRPNAECNSGFCASRVCCNTACTGTCMSCALTGSVGTCTPIAAGQPPLVAPSARWRPPSPAGYDGTCNGAGACRKLRRPARSARPPTCTPVDAHAGPGSATATGTAPRPTGASCGDLTCDSDTALQDHLHGRRRLRLAQYLQRAASAR